MSQVKPSTRRDLRIELPPATASVEFEWAGSDEQQLRGEVVTISTAGLAFTLADDPAIEVGTMLTPASVRINEKIIQGELRVRYSRSAEGSGIECGCLFYPASLNGSVDWMLFVIQRSGEGSSPPPQLALRCANCHSTVWVCVEDRASHQCPACNQEYRFAKPLRQGKLEDMYQRACSMAVELGIDLPSAVSMQLGIMKLSEVKDILDVAPPIEPASEAPGKTRKLLFDKAFIPAIEAGTLTEAAAIQRGSREAYAKRLVARHRISLDGAYAVADNRTSLLSLVRKRTAGEPIRAKYDRPATPTRVALVAALAGIALLVGVGALRQFDNAFNRPVPDTEPQRTASADRFSGAGEASIPGPSVAPDPEELPVESYARVRMDEGGDILSVEAMDPDNALLAFCKSHGPQRRLEPVEVVPTEPPSDSARIGLLRDLDEAAGYRIVVIRRDPQTRRWYLGNADDSDAMVSMFPAPERLIQAASNPY